MEEVIDGMEPPAASLDRLSGWRRLLESRAAADSQPRLASAVMCLIIAWVAIHKTIDAASRSFWYDEILTVIMARQPTLRAMWDALRHGADGQPPCYYIVERLTAGLLRGLQAEIAYRVPSILGCAVALWCMFVFVRRRDGAWVAVLSASTLLATPLASHAVEARPYALVAALVAIALLAYERAEKTRWLVILGVSLIAAQLLSYYAIFAVVPFAAAEMALTIKTKQLRKNIWITLACALVPFIVSWPILKINKEIYGAHIWDPPLLSSLWAAYGDRFQQLVFLVFVLGLAVAICADFLSRSPAIRIQEHVLALTLLALPIIGLIALKITDGAFTPRYFIAMVLGVPLVTAFAFRLIGRRTVPLALAGFLMFAFSARKEFRFWRIERGHIGKLVNPADPIESLASSAGYQDLPLVVSSGQSYLELEFYGSASFSKRIVALIDAPKSVAYAGSDSVDKSLSIVADFYPPARVASFADFGPGHRRFLLFSGEAKRWDWWPRRLADDGYSLQLVASSGPNRIYLVTPGASADRDSD